MKLELKLQLALQTLVAKSKVKLELHTVAYSRVEVWERVAEAWRVKFGDPVFGRGAA